MNHNMKHNNMCIRTLHQSIASSIFVQLAFEAIGVFQRPGEGVENVGFHKDPGPKTHSSEFSGLRMRDGRASLNPVRGLTELSLVIRGPDALLRRSLGWRRLTRHVCSIRARG